MLSSSRADRESAGHNDPSCKIPLKNEYEYSYHRLKLLNAMSSNRFDKSTVLSDQEQVVDRYMRFLKALGTDTPKPEARSSRPIEGLSPANSTWEAIRATVFYRLLRDMPKGANLGLAEPAVNLTQLLMEFRHHRNLYVAPASHPSPAVRGIIGFYSNPPLGFVASSTLNETELANLFEYVPSVQLVSEDTVLPPVMTGEEASFPSSSSSFSFSSSSSSSDIPKAPSGRFRRGLLGVAMRLRGFVHYDPVWRRALELSFGNLRADGVSYVEMRVDLGARYTLSTDDNASPLADANANTNDDAGSSRVLPPLLVGEDTGPDFPNSTTPNEYGQRLVDPSGSSDLFLFKQLAEEEARKSSEEHAHLSSDSASTTTTTTTRFFGAGCILRVSRHLDDARLKQELQRFLTLRQGNEDVLKGIDISGEEEYGRSFASMLPVFASVYEKASASGRAFTDLLPLYLKAGESTAPIDSRVQANAPDTASHNLVDALLLGSRRVSQPLLLPFYPSLLREYVSNSVVLEVSPVTNFLLGYTPRSSAHPFVQLANAGAKLVLTSDVPTLLGYVDMTMDWTVAFRRFGLTLSGLKTLAKNSLEQANLPSSTKAEALAAWETQWKSWIGQVAAEACVTFPLPANSSAPFNSSDPSAVNTTTSVSYVFPSIGPVEGGTVVQLIGTGFQHAICGAPKCRFGKQESAGVATWLSDTAIECITPPSPELVRPSKIIPSEVESSTSTSSSFVSTTPTTTLLASTLTASGSGGVSSPLSSSLSLASNVPASDAPVAAGTESAFTKRRSSSSSASSSPSSSSFDNDDEDVYVFVRFSLDNGKTYALTDSTFGYSTSILPDPDAGPPSQSFWQRYQVPLIAAGVGVLLLAGGLLAWFCIRRRVTLAKRRGLVAGQKAESLLSDVSGASSLNGGGSILGSGQGSMADRIGKSKPSKGRKSGKLTGGRGSGPGRRASDNDADTRGGGSRYDNDYYYDDDDDEDNNGPRSLHGLDRYAGIGTYSSTHTQSHAGSIGRGLAFPHSPMLGPSSRAMGM